jgi:flagella synthesis protein FlgN
MNQRDALKRLMMGVGADRNDYRRLRELLEQQFAAALKHDAGALAVLNDEILALVERLDANRRERPELTATVLGTGKKATIEAVIDSLSGLPARALEEWWDELKQLVARCKELNARNGQLMASQFEIMQRVLHGESDTYVAG